MRVSFVYFVCSKRCFDDGIGPTHVVKIHVGCSDEISIKNSANSVTKIKNLQPFITRKLNIFFEICVKRPKLLFSMGFDFKLPRLRKRLFVFGLESVFTCFQIFFKEAVPVYICPR